MRSHLALAACACALAMAVPASAEPLQPTHDDQIVERLPNDGARDGERELRRQWAADRSDPALAAALARRYLERAQELGDPRFAGRALSVLAAWPDAATAPIDVLLLRATLEQHLHAFDAAIANLQALVRRQPRHAQAWLTLATVQRVQGRYGASDAACRGVAASGAALHAQACLAENAGLRGEFERARGVLDGLLAVRGLPPQTRSWLETTRAELEARAGRSDAADQAYRRALAAQRESYTLLSYADFLLQNDRAADALRQLRDEPRTDAVLLRLAIAGAQVGSAQAARDAQELAERFAAAGQRPGDLPHARERAMAALWIAHDARRALALSRINLERQREPADLLLLAQAARAAGDAAALREARAARQQMGLHDARLDSLL